MKRRGPRPLWCSGKVGGVCGCWGLASWSQPAWVWRPAQLLSWCLILGQVNLIYPSVPPFLLCEQLIWRLNSVVNVKSLEQPLASVCSLLFVIPQLILIVSQVSVLWGSFSFGVHDSKENRATSVILQTWKWIILNVFARSRALIQSSLKSPGNVFMSVTVDQPEFSSGAGWHLGFSMLDCLFSTNMNQELKLRVSIMGSFSFSTVYNRFPPSLLLRGSPGFLCGELGLQHKQGAERWGWYYSDTSG